MSDPIGIYFDPSLLRNLPDALQREWLVANGIGGYASATLPGANTRHYHGLLVAALDAPLGRAVLLSKLDETLEVHDPNGTSQRYELGVNLYPGTVHPQGYQWLDAWSLLPTPTWTWAIAPDLRFEKRVWMAHGKNVTYISYRLISCPPDAKVHLKLLPLIAWRDYHSEMIACADTPPVGWQPASGSDPAALCLKLPPITRVTTTETILRLNVTTEAGGATAGTEFEPHSDWYYRFQHPREAERGLDSSEDLYQPGIISIPLSTDEIVVVVAGVGDTPFPAPGNALENVTQRQQAVTSRLAGYDSFVAQLGLAADAFVVQAPNARSTVIAGYHWFGDWGRDTMISLPGLCLTTRRGDVAREILCSFAEVVDAGMLPNRFPDAGQTPEYNTVDATLWYFVAIWRYIEATGDLDVLQRRLWTVLQEIVRCHREGTRYNIHVDASDDLLYAGHPGVQLTWMDARVGDRVVTPRIGKPVEINALWYNALRTMADLAGRLGDSVALTDYATQAQRTFDSFQRRFARADGCGLYDVLDTPNGGSESSIRPNQVFALSLPFAPLDPISAAARSVIDTVRNELWTPCGLRTLAPSDPSYRGRYGGGPAERDSVYHQGTAWPWLLGPFAEAYFRVTGDRDGARALLEPLRGQLTVYGVGSLAEIYDGSEPQRPNGCIAQAWSVAETLRVLANLKQ